MKIVPLIIGTSLAWSGQSIAQPVPMDMPGMTMPAHPKAKAAKAKAKMTAHEKPTKAAAGKTSRNAASPNHRAATPAPGNTPPKPMRDGGMAMPNTSQDKAVPKPPIGHGAMNMPMAPQATNRAAPGRPAMGDMPMGGSAKGHGAMAMGGAQGPYPMQRESSGTSWQPDASEHMGLMSTSGGWMLMAHGTVNLVDDHQSGPRGDDKTLMSGMLMGMASHPLGDGNVQFKAMLSPDPLMGPRGYPLLLASGETANGRDRLIDRQHPHDVFMELSGSVSQNVGAKSSVFIYGGLPGEPAFGPPAFMHRESIMDSPEAPITHHWLDSTHITFGVLTAGLVLDLVKVEVSRFNAREPDQHRWNIETGPLDSTSVRLSWNPTRTVSLQGSWAYLKDPEQLEPGVSQKRWSASALWANDLAHDWHAAATIAWGRKTVHGHDDDGFAAEASLKHEQWTIFGRGEIIENRELIQGQDEPAYRVGKVSLGAIRDFKVADHLSLGPGALFSVNFVPDALAPLYGGHNPTGAMGFIRLKLD